MLRVIVYGREEYMSEGILLPPFLSLSWYKRGREGGQERDGGGTREGGRKYKTREARE